MPDQAADPANDPMFGKIVKGAQAWHQHQQDVAHLSAGEGSGPSTPDTPNQED